MMTTKERDFHLVQKALGGDSKACETIYNRFNRAVNYQIGKIVMDTEIALDLTMETFEKIFTRLHRYQPDYCLSTWVSRIATNTALDYTRKVGRVTVVSIEASIENEDVADIQVMDDEPIPDERIILTQKMTYLTGLMRYMQPNECRLLQLYYVNDMGYTEIADEMDISVRVVRQYIRDARNKLRKLTQEISMREVLTKEQRRYEKELQSQISGRV